MIALSSQLPLLRVGRYDVPPGDGEWLEAGLRRAAREAGRDEWWPAGDVARGILGWLRDSFPGTVITLEELSVRVRSTLENIGYEEIAARLHLAPPRLDVSLHDLAREAGGGFELEFFRLLEARLNELESLGVRTVILTNRRDGVKHLRRAKYWTRSCRALEQEILQFLRVRVERAGRGRVEVTETGVDS